MKEGCNSKIINTNTRLLPPLTFWKAVFSTPRQKLLLCVMSNGTDDGAQVDKATQNSTCSVGSDRLATVHPLSSPLECAPLAQSLFYFESFFDNVVERTTLWKKGFKVKKSLRQRSAL